MENILTAKRDVNHTIFDDHINPLFCYSSVLQELEDICLQCLAQCKAIRIPESRKFLVVESGILGIGIQNPAKE